MRNLKGIGIIELSAYAPTEEPNATTDVSIQVNGKDLKGSTQMWRIII